MQGLERAVSLLTLKAGGQRECAFGHDGVRSVAATSLHAAEDTVGANVVGILGVVGRWVVVGLSAGAVGVGGGGVGDRVGGGGVRVWGSRVGAGLADEAVDGVRAVHCVLVSYNGENMVVVTLLERTAKVLAGLCSRLVIVALGESPRACAVKASNSTSNLGVAAVAGLRVVVSENTGLLDIVGGEVVASVVLGERLERSVAVFGLTLVPLSHRTVDVTVGDVGVGHDELVHGKQTIDVGVVEPEDGVKRRDIKVVHVATRLTASSIVNSVVDRLEAVNTATAQVSADTNLRGRRGTPWLLAREQSKDTVTERDAHSVEAGVHLVVVAASRVGNRTTEREGVVVPWTTTDLTWERVAPAVRVEGVRNSNRSRRLGDSDGLVTDQGRNGRIGARVLSPVPVGHAQSCGSLVPSALLAGGEGPDDLLNALVPGLL